MERDLLRDRLRFLCLFMGLRRVVETSVLRGGSPYLCPELVERVIPLLRHRFFVGIPVHRDGRKIGLQLSYAQRKSFNGAQSAFFPLGGGLFLPKWQLEPLSHPRLDPEYPLFVKHNLLCTEQLFVLPLVPNVSWVDIA